MSTPFGPYRLIRRIASGGMGEVYLAVLERPGGFAKTVALKMVLPAGSPERFQLLFESEAAVAAALNHANIVQVFDHGTIEGKSFLTMELVEGPDLATLLAAAGPVFPPEVAVEIGVQTCRGLDHAHRRRDLQGRAMGIVHRDVSPPNILVSADGQVKLADFGLAAVRRAAGSEGLLAGKLCYMSPEQARGEELGPGNDLYALGLVLFEMLAGQKAFEPLETAQATLAAVRDGNHRLATGGGRDIEQALREVIGHVLEPDPDKRHQAASDLAADLAAACPACGPEKLSAFVRPHAPAGGTGKGLAPEPTEVAQSPVATRESTRATRRRWRLPLVVLAIACWGAGIAWWAFSPAPPPRPAPPSRTIPRAPGGLDVRATVQDPVTEPEKAPADVPVPAPEKEPDKPPEQIRTEPTPALDTGPDPVETGAVRIEFDSAVQCELDHRAVTDGTATLESPGPHLIRLRPKNAASPEALLRLAPAGQGGLRLAVNANPWMRIRIDGRTAGQTPRSKLHLAPGQRRIELERNQVVFRLVIRIPGATP